MLPLLIAAAAALAVPATGGGPMVPLPLVEGDETMVVTHHRIKTGQGVLAYDAIAGRLPVRNDESGEVRGHAFFVAYVARSQDGRPRPLTVIWNGGPTTSSILLHTQMFGPRRLDGDHFVDNAETLLKTSDLVFYDPIGTGFSRPENAAAEPEFLSTLGDFAATAEFVRAYRAAFRADDQPLFLAGESYGTWRVSGVSELLAERGVPIAGAILISGGMPGSQMSYAFNDAMAIPARTAAAFAHDKLPADLMRDRATTLAASERWARDVYWPALEHVDALDPAQREEIAADLARYTGFDVAKIDRKALVVTNSAYLHGLLGSDAAHKLDTYDMRLVGPQPDAVGDKKAIGDYLRGELGYATDLAYTDVEDGYMPAPGPARRSTGDRWDYNHVAITPEMIAHMQSGSGPPASQPWLQHALRIEPGMRVFVAAGRFDSYNMCAGNLVMTAKLGPAVAARVTNRCYEGGHMMYAHDAANRATLAGDVARFETGAASR